MEGRIISIVAAEKIFSMVDDSRAKRSNYGYDKWKFQILKNGEENPVWIDRYDMGDGNGGFIQFMQNYQNRGADFDSMVDTLEAMTNGGYILSSVSIAPWIKSAISEKEKAESEYIKDVLDMVDFLTDEQFESAIMSIPNDEPQKLDIVRFFLQELAKRDEKKALETFRAWKRGEGFPL